LPRYVMQAWPMSSSDVRMSVSHVREFYRNE